MPTTEASAAPTTPPVEAMLTWTVTDTYIHPIDLHTVATAAARSVEELRADPALILRGLVPRPVADLLAAHEHEAVTIGEPEVEITDAYLADQPTLDDLIRAGWQHLHARPDTDRPTAVGRALAACWSGCAGKGSPTGERRPGRQ
jgi:hypothetical protein